MTGGFDNDWAEACRICPRDCGVDRRDARGFCGAPADLVVASAGPHFGEEAPLVGAGGSGTIFLAGCNLKCVFCQNDNISRQIVGSHTDPAGVAGLMGALEERGCENVNFVTPTHYAPALADAIERARTQGLTVPVVWNCGGCEKLDSLRPLDGLVEIYMPDVKFFDEAACSEYLHATDYPERVRDALREMHRQVGDLEIQGGVAVRGLLVRHLVMPGFAADSRRILGFLAQEISPDTYVNVMGQYRPCADALAHAAIARRPTPKEIASAKAYALELGLRDR